jgi:hypothetical protein
MYSPKVVEDKPRRRIFEPESEAATGSRKKWRTEELYQLHSSLHIVR